MEEKNQKSVEINSTEELNEQLNKLKGNENLNRPSEEETEAAKQEFEKAAEEWTSKTYVIGKKEDALENCNYLLDFLKNRFFWQKDAWMGVIKLNEELSKIKKAIEKEEKELTVGYQALEFIYYMLSNPGGVGLKSAKDFEKEKETFIKVASSVEEQVQAARKNLKDVEFLQQKWGAMAQGFYLEEEDSPEEEEEVSHENAKKDSEDSKESE